MKNRKFGMYSKVALITGITGQAGSWLAEHLRSLDYLVFGMYRRSSSALSQNFRLKNLLEDDGVEFLQGDLEDYRSIEEALDYAQPDEIYNLAAMSFVGSSFQQPAKTLQVTGCSLLNLLEAVRKYTKGKRPKIYQASTSEMYGTSWTGVLDPVKRSLFNSDTPLTEEFIAKYSPFQDEKTPFAPVSPYAVAKLTAHHLAHTYRKAYGLFVSCGIMFNFESSRRGEEFVTRKICKALARIKSGKQKYLKLGNLAAYRDWSDARDTVRAMQVILQQDFPLDICVGSGESYTVKHFLDEAVKLSGLEKLGREVVLIDPALHRPNEVPYLCCNNKELTKLGWKPEYNFQKMIGDMILAEDKALSEEKVNKEEEGDYWL